MKKIFLLVLLMGVALCQAVAQQDAKAESILSKMADSYRKAGGISLTFGGTQQGNLLLKGNKFCLESGGIKTWFDGKTQWSYVEQNEEVNVSSPTPEEIQSINPYALLTSYKKGFNYRYVGEKTRQGKRGHEIILTPKTAQDIKSITLNVKENSSPVYIAIQLQNGEKQEFQISSYRTGVNLPDVVFRFDKSKYPGAEIIDLR